MNSIATRYAVRAAHGRLYWPTVARRVLAVLAALSPLLGQQYVISTFAGGVPPSAIPAVNAGLDFVWGVTTDSAGNVYFTSMHSVFRIDLGGMLSVVAGDSHAGYLGDGGPANKAQLYYPRDMALDGAGNIYVADSGNNCIRKITPGGMITTVGTRFGPFLEGSLTGVAVDAAGNIYASAPRDNRVYKIAPDGTRSIFLSQWAGSTAGDHGLTKPGGLAVDRSGNLYIADYGNACVRKVDGNGLVMAVAGRCGIGYLPSSINPIGLALDSADNLFVDDFRSNVIFKWPVVIAGVSGSGPAYGGDNGPATSAGLGWPQGVAVDRNTNVYIADLLNFRVRRVTPDGIITTVAGNGTQGDWGDGGPARSAGLHFPGSVAVDQAGNVYAAETSCIRKITPAGIISTVLTREHDSGTLGWLTADRAGNIFFAETYIADKNRSNLETVLIRKLTAGGTLRTVAGGGTRPAADGDSALNAQFRRISGLAVDTTGNLYVGEGYRQCVRKVSPDGMITTVAGNGPSNSCVEFVSSTSPVIAPRGLAADSRGNVFILGLGDATVRRLSPDGTITVLPGSGAQSLEYASLQAADSDGNLYLSSPFFVLKRSPAGIITRIAGHETTDLMSTFYGDGGPALEGMLWNPVALALDEAGNIYIADSSNNAIRLLRPRPGQSPVISAITDFASHHSAPLAPGEIFTLAGSGLGPLEAAQYRVTDGGHIDTTLAGTRVFFNGIPAPILYASDRQLAAIVPYSVRGPGADMVVSFQGRATNPVPVLISPCAPALFTADSSGQGPAAAVNQDSSINSVANPAPAGSVISLYSTGEGQTIPTGADGQVASSTLPKPILPVSVTITTQTAPVLYAGAAPGLVAGVMQVNVQIPADTASGNIPVVLTVGGASSQSGVTIAVR